MLKLFKDSFIGPYFVSVMWALITGLKDKLVGHRLGTSYQFAMTGKTKPNNLGKARKKLHKIIQNWAKLERLATSSGTLEESAKTWTSDSLESSGSPGV